jgi:hypothetical protein
MDDKNVEVLIREYIEESDPPDWGGLYDALRKEGENVVYIQEIMQQAREGAY